MERNQKKDHKRIEYKFEDITDTDFALLRKAYFLQDPAQFLCYGKHFYKLKALNLIDDENQLTFKGKGFVKYILGKLEQ